MKHPRAVIAPLAIGLLSLTGCTTSGSMPDASPNFTPIEDTPDVAEPPVPVDSAAESEASAQKSLSTSQVCNRLTSGGDSALLFRIPEHVVEIMTDPDVSDADLAEIEYITQEVDEMTEYGPAYLASDLEDIASVHYILLDASVSGESAASYSPASSFLAAINLGEICLEGDELTDFANDMIELMEGAPR